MRSAPSKPVLARSGIKNELMRITGVIHSLAGGGSERVLAGLVNRLAERGHAVTLITLDAGGQDRWHVDASVDRRSLGLLGDSQGLLDAIRQNLRRRRLLGAAIETSQPDVILSFCDRTNVLTLLAAARIGVPIVVAERSDPAMQTLGPFWERLRKRTYRRASRVTTLTAAAARQVQAWTPRPVTVIPSAVDPPAACVVAPGAPANPRRSSGSEPNATGWLLGVGRLAPEKGFDRLIEAFAANAVASPGWRLRIAGDGPQRRDLEQQIAKLGLQSRVELPGWTQPIAPLYDVADLFVLSSRYEGFPSALLEAMAHGVACLAVDTPGGQNEIIAHDKNGWLAPPEQLADRLGRLMHSPEDRRRLGGAATEVLQRFSWQTMVDRYEKLLREVAGA